MSKMRYGVAYKGSKSRIVERLVESIPHEGVENFYDLFAGGCAVTHKMLLDGRYGHVFANDLDGQGVRLFDDGIHGKYLDEKRWISREDFNRLKGVEPYVAICWSFGNNQRDYMYSAKIEPYKKACHYAVVLDDFSLLRELCPEVADACEEALEGVADTHERRIKFGPTIVNWLKAHGTPEMVANNPLYSSCHVKHDTKTRPKGAIRDLNSLESLESLQSLSVSTTSYDAVEIKPNSVIYCDPPYIGTNTYSKRSSVQQPFDHDRFYDWCCEQKELVLVSEYAMPEDRFSEVWSTSHVQSLCSSKTSAVTERLYVPKHQLGMYERMMRAERGKEARCEELELFPAIAANG